MLGKNSDYLRQYQVLERTTFQLCLQHSEDAANKVSETADSCFTFNYKNVVFYPWLLKGGPSLTVAPGA